MFVTSVGLFSQLLDFIFFANKRIKERIETSNKLNSETDKDHKENDVRKLNSSLAHFFAPLIILLL